MNESKHLTPINNHIPKSAFGADKFSDDHTHQAKSDVDFHDGKEIRDVGGQHDLEEYVGGAAVKCADELDFIR